MKYTASSLPALAEGDGEMKCISALHQSLPRDAYKWCRQLLTQWAWDPDTVSWKPGYGRPSILVYSAFRMLQSGDLSKNKIRECNELAVSDITITFIWAGRCRAGLLLALSTCPQKGLEWEKPFLHARNAPGFCSSKLKMNIWWGWGVQAQHYG